MPGKQLVFGLTATRGLDLGEKVGSPSNKHFFPFENENPLNQKH